MAQKLYSTTVTTAGTGITATAAATVAATVAGVLPLPCATGMTAAALHRGRLKDIDASWCRSQELQRSLLPHHAVVGRRQRAGRGRRKVATLRNDKELAEGLI